MSDSAPNSAALPIVDGVPPQQSADTKRQLSAALFSPFLPGAGQLLLGQRRKGIVLLLVFVALISCIFPLRLPRSFVALISIVWTWLGLSIYALCAALLKRRIPLVRRPSKWWLLSMPLLVYVGFNLIFTPLFLVSGFRARKFDSSAMEKTLLTGDQFIIDENYYRNKSVARNDLVLMHRRDYQTVKRVVAIGGDTIEGKNRQILLNGRLVDEPFIQHALSQGSNPEQDSFGPVTVPAGKYFVWATTEM
jgi:signal peptidase I